MECLMPTQYKAQSLEATIILPESRIFELHLLSLKMKAVKNVKEMSNNLDHKQSI